MAATIGRMIMSPAQPVAMPPIASPVPLSACGRFLIHMSAIIPRRSARKLKMSGKSKKKPTIPMMPKTSAVIAMPDVFGSAATYLKTVGWLEDQTWGREIKLPAGFDQSLASLKVVKRMAEWQALGVRRIDGADLPARQLDASIVVPDEESGRAFLVYENFRNILKWNRSNYFALAVGLLADGIADR